ncbi:MAG: hypothetical protein ACI4JJ_01395 [Huintestinicola sp.]
MKCKAVLAVMLAAVMLAGCNKGDNRDKFYTEGTVSEPVDTEFELYSEDSVSDEEEREFSESHFDTLELFDYFIKADFSGTVNYGGNEYKGTLTLRCFEKDENGQQGGEVSSYVVYDNTEFTANPSWDTGNFGLVQKTFHIVALESYDYSTAAEAVSKKRVRLFEIEKDGSIIPISVKHNEKIPYESDILSGEYEILAESLLYSVNSELHIGTNSDYDNCIYRFYDCGVSRYNEFWVNTADDTVYLADSMEWVPDYDLSVLADAAYNRILLINGKYTYSDYRNGFEFIRKDDRDKSYYRVPDGIASNMAELREYVSEYFTERYARDVLFGENFSADEYFYEDDMGLVACSFYDGVPDSVDFSKFRITERTDSTAVGFAPGSNVAESILKQVSFVKENGRWAVDDIHTFILGEYLDPFAREIFIDGKLYYGTAETADISYGDKYEPDGRITSSVNYYGEPSKEGESNFGCIGHSYIRGENGDSYMVDINGRWFLFTTERQNETEY